MICAVQLTKDLQMRCSIVYLWNSHLLFSSALSFFFHYLFTVTGKRFNMKTENLLNCIDPLQKLNARMGP